MIGADQHNDLPDRIRARMSTPFSPTSTAAQIRRAALEVVARYQAMVLDASANECVLPADALATAAAAGKSPMQLLQDLDGAQRAYIAWRLSVDP